MTLIQSSILYNYLYSPINWLHQQPTSVKICAFLFLLIYLPYTSLDKIFYLSIILFVFYLSISIPKIIVKNIKNLAIVFLFFTITNIQNESTLTNNILIDRDYIQIYPLRLSIFTQIQINSLELLSNSYFISNSFIRLLSINLISLLIMRLLLLTTLYESLLLFFFKYLYKIPNKFCKKFFFEVNIAIEFIQVIFKQLETIRYSFMIRFLQLNKKLSYQEYLTIYFFCFKQLIIKIQKQIYFLAESLFSREIY